LIDPTIEAIEHGLVANHGGADAVDVACVHCLRKKWKHGGGISAVLVTGRKHAAEPRAPFKAGIIKPCTVKRNEGPIDRCARVAR
jgi:hypothetical protein